MLFIFWVHLDLIISWKAIYNRQPFKTTRVVNHDICDG